MNSICIKIKIQIRRFDLTRNTTEKIVLKNMSLLVLKTNVVTVNISALLHPHPLPGPPTPLNHPFVIPQSTHWAMASRLLSDLFLIAGSVFDENYVVK